MSLSAPEPIDDDGVINVHARGSFIGANFEVNETDAATGALINLRDVPLYFEIDAIALRKSLPLNPQDPNGRLMPDLSVAELATLSNEARWEVWDESGGHRTVIMHGKIRKYG
jgi:hypothetical protein